MRRHARLFLLLTALALAAAACGGGAADTTAEASPGATDPTTSAAAPTAPAEGAATEPSPDATTDAAAFPVTVPHKFGEAVIEAPPERVVSVGFNDQDTLLALGVTPVGVREWYGDYPYATWPWAQDELGDATPEVLPAAEINFEAVAALDPDLIVGVFSGMTADDYELLSQIAPTVAQPAEYTDFGTPWREVTRIYGRAVGAPDRAEQVIADLDARLAEVRDNHPGFTESTGVVAFFADGDLGAYASQDLRSRLLTDMGFAIPDAIDEAAGEGGFFAEVSPERADLIDTDVLLWVTATPAELQALQELPVRRTLDAYREGREVLLSFELNGAMSFSSPLSIPFFLDGTVPLLEQAVDGDPDTAVPLPAGPQAQQ